MIEVKDGVMDLTPQPEKRPESRPGAETVAYELGIINEKQFGNPFHGLRARPGQYIVHFPKTFDSEKKDMVGIRKDMYHVINSYLHGQPARVIEKNKYKFAEQE